MNSETHEIKYNILDFLKVENINNICDLIDEDILKEIGRSCKENYSVDAQKFEEKESEIRQWYDLALQTKKMRNYPWKDAHCAIFPLLTKAVIEFVALVSSVMVKDNKVVMGEVVGDDNGERIASVVNPDEPLKDENKQDIRNIKKAGKKRERAERVATFMSWQFLEDMDGWAEDCDRLWFIVAVVGFAYHKVCYDTNKRKTECKLVLPQYLVLDQNARSLEQASRISEVIELRPNQIKALENSNTFRAIEYNKSAETLTSTDDSTITNDDTSPHIFIEQHCFYDFDGDGYEEPYIVWFHKETSEVVRIVPRFREEDILYQKPKTLTEIVKSVAGKKQKIIKITPHNIYVQYCYMPDPEGSPYPIGLGKILGPLNEQITKALEHIFDSAEKRNAGGGFTTGIGKSGVISYQPGDYVYIDTKMPGMPIQSAVQDFSMPEDPTTLFQLLTTLMQYGSDLANVSFNLSQLGANTPAITALTQIEQSLRGFTAIFQRLKRSLKKVYKIVFYYDSIYTTQEEYQKVLGNEFANVKEDFNKDDVSVIPIADADMLSNTQEMLRVQILEQYKDDPVLNKVEIYKRIFTGLRVKDIEELFMPPSPPQIDPLTQQQVQSLQANDALQAQKFEHDKEKAMMEFQIKQQELILQEKDIEIKNMKAQTSGINDLASADQKRHGAVSTMMSTIHNIETSNANEQPERE